MPKNKPSPVAAAPVAENSFDPNAAEKAFDAFKPRMLGLDPQKLATLSVDLEKAAIFAAELGRWIKKKEQRERFASLPAKYFDLTHVDNLEEVALAAWHAAVALRSANAGKTEAKLPVPLVTDSTSVKQRMITLTAYHLAQFPADIQEVEDIKVGTGYADLASDLLRLAKLYAKHRDLVQRDPTYYKATDEADAGRLAHAIMRELGEARNQEQKLWTDLVQRAWTLLEQTYGEVSVPGAWLWRGEADVERFASIYSAGRTTPVRAAKDAKTPPGDKGGGSQEPPKDGGK